MRHAPLLPCSARGWPCTPPLGTDHRSPLLSYYTVGMILRLTEGSLAPVSCLDGDKNTCERRENCGTLFIWEELYKAICGVVDNITIADIINKGADNYII